MDTIEAICQRRSVKFFDKDCLISDQELRELLALTMTSPSAFNIQHWRFVVVQDKSLRKALRAASWNQAQVTDAAALVVLCADMQAWKKTPERYWHNAPEDVRNMMLSNMHDFYQAREQMQRDEAMRSAGIAAQTLMLAAKAKGYDTCPMDGFDFDAVSKLISLPDDHLLSMFIAIGKPLEPAFPRPGQLNIEDVIVYDRF